MIAFTVSAILLMQLAKSQTLVKDWFSSQGTLIDILVFLAKFIEKQIERELARRGDQVQ